MKKLFAASIILFLFCCEPGHSQQKSCMPIFAVYPSWKTQVMPIDTIPWNRFTHLVLAFALPQADGSLNTSQIDPIIKQLSHTAHAQHKSLHLSIGGALGYEDAFQQIAQSPEKLKLFSAAIAHYVKENQIDGIDIDWEYWTRQAKQNLGGNDSYESQLLVNLLATLRQELPKNILLTTDVFAGDWLGSQYLPALQEHVDYVAFMAYDFTGAWSNSAVGHHADFNTFKAGIDYLINRSFKREKMIVGIPFYGKEFIDGKNQKVIDKDYRDLIPQLVANKKSINSGKINHIYFETPELVTKKSHYLIGQQLAGVMFFEMTQDTDDASTSLALASNAVIAPTACHSPEQK